MTKKVLRTYVRQNEDWGYINYLENRITEMKNELKKDKALNTSLRKNINRLYYENEKLENELTMLKEQNKSLKNELLNEYINNLP